jgi:hypothetical protein
MSPSISFVQSVRMASNSASLRGTTAGLMHLREV